MPYKWIPPELFMEYKGVSIYYTHYDNNADSSRISGFYGTNLEYTFGDCNCDGEGEWTYVFCVEKLINYSPEKSDEETICEAIDLGLLVADRKSPVPIQLYWTHKGYEVRDTLGIGVARMFVASEAQAKQYVYRLLELHKRKQAGESFWEQTSDLDNECTDTQWAYLGKNGRIVRMTEKVILEYQPDGTHGLYYVFEFKDQIQDSRWFYLGTFFYQTHYPGESFGSDREDFSKRLDWLLDNFFDSNYEMMRMSWYEKEEKFIKKAGIGGSEQYPCLA